MAARFPGTQVVTGPSCTAPTGYLQGVETMSPSGLSTGSYVGKITLAGRL
jgi:hypothetical protein